jgi:hypothetical protein
MSAMGFAAWPGIAATLVGIGLLIAFHQVVRTGVQQGETRRQAVAMRADAEWRCKALRLPSARIDCLLQADSAQRDGVAMLAEHAAAIALR